MNLLKKIAPAFRRVFDRKNNDSKVVLKYLAEYCCFSKTTCGNDILEGRRQVFLKIIKLSNMTDAEIHNLIENEKNNNGNSITDTFNY